METFLFKSGELSYHILTREYRDEALICLSRAFCTEPVCEALVELRPEMKVCMGNIQQANEID